MDGSRVPARLGRISIASLVSLTVAGTLSACLGVTGSATSENVLVCGQSLGPKSVLSASWPPVAPRTQVKVPILDLTTPASVHALHTFAPGPPVILHFSIGCGKGVNVRHLSGVRLTAVAHARGSSTLIVAARAFLLVRSMQSHDSLTFTRSVAGGIEFFRATVQMNGA